MPEEAADVTVTLLGHRSGHHDVPSSAEFRHPDADRPRVRLRVKPDDTLADVVERAAAELGVTVEARSLAFYDPKRDVISLAASTVTLVEAEGRATWNHPLAEATWRQVVASAEAGVLAGDPHRAYLVTGFGRGNGAVPDWDTIKAIWQALDFVLSVIGAAAAAKEAQKWLATRLREKTQAASQVVERHSADWESRGGDPYTLHHWLDDRVWSSADLAAALGCTEAEAEAVLWSFGFAHSPSCVWRRADDEESKFINEVHGVGYAVTGASPEQVRQVLDVHTRRFLMSGRAPTIGWQDLEWLHPSPVVRPVARVWSRLSRARDWLRRRKR